MPVVRVGDINVHYELRGQGPALAFVPGLSLDSRVWDRVVRLLAYDFTCVMPDPRGAGLTTAPRGPYTVTQLASDLYGLLTVVGVDEATVVGHSMGGYQALQLALDSPELVRALVLVSTSGTGRRSLLGMSDEARRALTRSQGPIAEIVRDNVQATLGRRFLEQHREAVEQFITARLDRPPRGRGVQAQRAAADAFDVRSRLWEIHCPSTVVHGTDDRMIPLARGQELASGIEGARLVELEGIGHLPQLEAPTELADEIMRTAKSGSVDSPR